MRPTCTEEPTLVKCIVTELAYLSISHTSHRFPKFPSTAKFECIPTDAECLLRAAPGQHLGAIDHRQVLFKGKLSRLAEVLTDKSLRKSSTPTWSEDVGSINMLQPQNNVNAPGGNGTVVNITGMNLETMTWSLVNVLL